LARIRVCHRADALEKILEAKIRQGHYLKNSRFPTERRLAAEYDYSRATIRKACQSLHHRGLLLYHNRGYQVPLELGDIEFTSSQNENKKYAIFFHQAQGDNPLLPALEQAIRQAGAYPVTFNLGAMEEREKGLDFLAYLHFPVQAAIFISNEIGHRRLLITEQMLNSLPLPFLFVDCLPTLATVPGLIMNCEDCVRQLAQYIQKQHPPNIEFLFPWPLFQDEADLLTAVSQQLPPFYVDGNNLEIRFISPKNEQKLVANSKSSLRVFTSRLSGLARSHLGQGEQIILGRFLGDRQFHQINCIEVPAQEMAQEAVRQIISLPQKPGSRKIYLTPNFFLQEKVDCYI